MFNYLFPIFCFGLVVTGIVVLGILEAARQANSDGGAAGNESENANSSRGKSE